MDYTSLFWMIIWSIIVSYAITSNVMLTFRNGIYNTLTKFLMALLMGSTMGAIMAGIMYVQMRSTPYAIIFIGSVIISIVLIGLIRKWITYNQVDFTEAMIEHHDMGILMSEQVLENPGQSCEVYALARSIIVTQQAEIDLMQSWLRDGFPGCPCSEDISCLNS